MIGAETQPLQIDLAGHASQPVVAEEQTDNQQVKTSWTSTAGLAISVLICTIAIVVTQYFFFLPSKENSQSPMAASTATKQSIITSLLPTDRDLVPCKSIADGRSIEPNTTCVVNPRETIQTYSAVKIWSYRDQAWVDPPGYTMAGTRTLINPPEDQSVTTAPVILTCPWGCTLGYPF